MSSRHSANLRARSVTIADGVDHSTQAVGPGNQPDRLTTADLLIVDSLLAHSYAGAPFTTLINSCWVTPQLEALEHPGLIRWEFDDEANFRVETTPKLFRLPEAELSWRRLLPAAANPPFDTDARKEPLKSVRPRIE